MESHFYFPASGHVEKPNMMDQVLKPLYGMPHPGRCLHVTWSIWLDIQGFQKAGYEGAMWSRMDKHGESLATTSSWQTNVDDSIVTGSHDDKTDIYVREMLGRFDGTCKRNLTDLLGMEWEREFRAGTSILHPRDFSENG